MTMKRYHYLVTYVGQRSGFGWGEATSDAPIDSVSAIQEALRQVAPSERVVPLSAPSLLRVEEVPEP